MKKTIAVLPAMLIALLLLAACGDAGYYDAASAPAAPMADPAPAPAPAADYGGTTVLGEVGMSHNLYLFEPQPSFLESVGEAVLGMFDQETENSMAYDEADYTKAEIVSLSTAESVSLSTTESVRPGLAEKIIYTAYAEVETTEFDEAVDAVERLIAQNGAFVESSYVRNLNHSQQHYGYISLRWANYTIRVPQNRLGPMTAGLEQVGHVVSVQNDAQNITAQFYDTESRLAALRTQEGSLLAMLAKAETVADMIIIEERLSDVRYQIESLTSTLRNWQTHIDYSTLTLNIQEVEKYSEPVVINRTYWQRIGDGLGSTTKGVGVFFSNLFAWLIIYLPVIIILGAIAVAVIIIVKRSDRKIRKRVAEREASKAAEMEAEKAAERETSEAAEMEAEKAAERETEKAEPQPDDE